MNKFIQACNKNFSQCQYPQNPSQNSSNNITNYQNYQNSISHQHCPKPTIQHEQLYKAPIPTRSHNNMTMSHHQTFNEIWNNIFPNKETKEKLTLMSMWEYGAWVLGSWRSPSSSFQSNVGSYFLPWKVRKEDPLEEEDMLVQRKDGFENGFHQKWVWQKCSRTQGSKEILREMSEGSLRSLEKFFFWEEMVWWRRKIKVKMRVNSVNGRRKDEGGRESKKRRRERRGKWGAKIRPPHLNSASCLVNYHTKKKKILF